MFLFFLFLFLINPIASRAAVFVDSGSVSVSARVGENEVTINGYTSPLSKVELTNPKVYSLTYSDKNGFFEFDRIVLPKNPSDLCIIATDNDSRQTVPTCIPPPPSINYHTDIGPIVLPPTITIDNDKIKPGSTIVSSGQSLPNSQIDIYFYQVDNGAISFPKPVEAFSLPVFSTKSDNLGNFDFSLPTAYTSNYRLFATVKFKDSPSPKSNTLTYFLPSLWLLFWQQNYFLIIILSVFIITLVFFFYLIFQQNRLPKRRYLPAVRNVWLTKMSYN